MNWHFTYTPSVWPSLITFLFLITLSVYSWRRRNVPGALAFAISSLFAALWAIGSVMEFVTVEMATKIFWFKFQGVWYLPYVAAVTGFILEYAWPARWLTRRNVTLLAIPCLIVFMLVLTNDLHHWIWRGFEYDGRVIPLRGPVNWIFLVYAYGLTFLNLAFLAWLFWRSPQHRRPVSLILIGQFLARMLFLLEAFQAPGFTSLLIIRMIPFEFLVYAIALFGFRIFDETALARQTAIEQMQEGMLVVDSQGKIISLNPVAEAILSISARRATGTPVLAQLPEYATVSGDLSTEGISQVEINRGTGDETREYTLTVSFLQDWRGLAAGRLLLLHDVTEHKRAQARFLEQQRALAMIHERERLARELHDSIGQVLGYAAFQVEAASKLAQDGQVEAATSQLDHLAGIVRQAHADVRQQILDLRAVPTIHESFFVAVRDYLDGFCDNYNISTLLSVDEGLDDEPFPPEARMQVFRIMQEALTNARKHGQARSIDVMFSVEDPLVCMTIQDDGVGFDPDQSGVGSDGHFGLKFMRERAGAIGGSLEVTSVPDQGTRVLARAPMTKNQPGSKREASDA